SPDDGFEEEARNIARVAGLESLAMNKKRVSDTKVEISLPPEADIEGKTVALTDDLISTGGTILESSKVLKDHGAKKINVYCVHGLFVTGTSKYAGFVDSISTTDTIEGPFSRMTVSDLISRELTEYI
ncbi:MAG: phosphoribosyltransferase family protein, partial [Thermoplasmatales archaeon]